MNRLKYSLIFCAYLFIAICWREDVYGFKIKLKKDADPPVNYNEWIPSQDFSAVVDGIRQFFPISVQVASAENPEEKELITVIKGNIPIRGLDARQIMLAALVYAQEYFNREAGEGLVEVDYGKKEFSMIVRSVQGTTSNETTYTRLYKIMAKDGSFDFEVTDIACKYKEKGLIPRTIIMEKLHPEKNRRHEELVKEFIGVNAGFINEMEKYISSRRDISTVYFEKLNRVREIEVGMDKDMTTILLGPPLDKRKSGQRERWIYSNEYVVIFTDGKITKIVK